MKPVQRLLCLLFAVVQTCVAAEDGAFQAWLEAVRQEALATGIREQVVVAALDGVTPDPRVIELDRAQPEFVQTLDEYLAARVNEQKVLRGRELLRRHRQQLVSVSEHYGVDPEYLVAFWGLESDFGRHQGSFSVVRSLATLAYDPRRSAYFRKELLAALRVLDQGHITPDRFVGGWAGAMGQNQFMPSTFLAFAQDYDGDGRKDIWRDQGDVWASIAYYLASRGWRKGEGWGLAVRVPADLTGQLKDLQPATIGSGCSALRQLTRRLPAQDWAQLGVSASSGGALPEGNLSLLSQEDPEAGRSYLLLPNFEVILDYNCANKYALSVGLLADRLRD